MLITNNDRLYLERSIQDIGRIPKVNWKQAIDGLDGILIGKSRIRGIDFQLIAFKPLLPYHFGWSNNPHWIFTRETTSKLLVLSGQSLVTDLIKRYDTQNGHLNNGYLDSSQKRGIEDILSVLRPFYKHMPDSWNSVWQSVLLDFQDIAKFSLARIQTMPYVIIGYSILPDAARQQRGIVSEDSMKVLNVSELIKIESQVSALDLVRGGKLIHAGRSVYNTSQKTRFIDAIANISRQGNISDPSPIIFDGVPHFAFISPDIGNVLVQDIRLKAMTDLSAGEMGVYFDKGTISEKDSTVINKLILGICGLFRSSSPKDNNSVTMSLDVDELTGFLRIMRRGDGDITSLLARIHDVVSIQVFRKDKFGILSFKREHAIKVLDIKNGIAELSLGPTFGSLCRRLQERDMKTYVESNSLMCI